MTNLCLKILVIDTLCCTAGSTRWTLHLVVLCNWDLANGRCYVIAHLKVMQPLAVPLQVWQDVQAHHDVLQQPLDLLVGLLCGARWLGERDGLKAVVLVWGEAVTREKLGVRGGAGVGRWSRGVGGCRVKKRGVCFVCWA